MSTELLAVLILTTTLTVVVALFLVMWRERTSARTSLVALVSGGVLAGWAAITMLLASRGFFVQSDVQSVPPVGIALVVALVGLAAPLTRAFPSCSCRRSSRRSPSRFTSSRCGSCSVARGRLRTRHPLRGTHDARHREH